MISNLSPHEAAVLLDSVAAQLGNTPGVLMVAQEALADVYRGHGLDEPADACDQMATALMRRADESARAEWDALPRHVRNRVAITPTAWVQRRTDQLVFAAGDAVRAVLEAAAPAAAPQPVRLPLVEAA